MNTMSILALKKMDFGKFLLQHEIIWSSQIVDKSWHSFSRRGTSVQSSQILRFRCGVSNTEDNSLTSHDVPRKFKFSGLKDQGI